MTLDNSAGQLRQWVAFLSRSVVEDGAGGAEAGFVEQFQERAAYHHLRGGEVVLAARLEGTHSLILRVRKSARVEAVSTDWVIDDIRTGKRMNIRDVEPSSNGMWIDFICQTGGAV